MLAIKEIIQKTLNIHSTISTGKKRNPQIKSLSIGGNTQVSNVLNYLYQDANIWMERKRNHYITSLEYIKNNSKKHDIIHTQFQPGHPYRKHR